MNVLVTGADGFVGRYLVRHLAATGHRVTGTLRAETAPPPGLDPGVRWEPLELDDGASAARLFREPMEAVVHLAALASGAEARRDPGAAWVVNAAGTARLLHAAAEARAAGTSDPLVLVVSTAEVYGASPPDRPLTEHDPVRPQSPYAASKAGAELAALETGRRTGLRVAIVRAFPHTGPGQSDRYVIPALLQRIRTARDRGAPAVKTGNLDPVRDYLDVRDVVTAYRLLLVTAEPGGIYNVASGVGRSLREIFDRLCRLLGARVVPECDASLTRAGDLPRLVGDASRLRALTGWAPGLAFDQTLRDMADAPTH